MRKRAVRTVSAEVGPGTDPTDEAVKRAALTPIVGEPKAAYIRESTVREHFYQQVEKRKDRCMAEKFVSPGKRGVPDEIIMWAGGRVHFVELKPPKGYKVQVAQARDHERRRKLGVEVWVMHTKQAVDEYFSLLW